jgi:hypothetical protein
MLRIHLFDSWRCLTNRLGLRVVVGTGSRLDSPKQKEGSCLVMNMNGKLFQVRPHFVMIDLFVHSVSASCVRLRQPRLKYQDMGRLLHCLIGFDSLVLLSIHGAPSSIRPISNTSHHCHSFVSTKELSSYTPEDSKAVAVRPPNRCLSQCQDA